MAKNDELRLRIPDALKTDLKNISKNTGITLSSLLKPVLRTLADSYPPNMKKEMQD